VLVLLALPPVWEFSAGGLDTGAVFLWTAGAWRLMVACRPQGRPGEPYEVRAGSRPYLCAFVVGLGPLVRPELALVSLVFSGALLWMLRPARRTAAGMLAVALALPVAYEIFRAGYYGVLLPLPAIAHEATGVHHERGRLYLEDFVDSYWMLLPLVLLVGLALVYACADKMVAPRSSPLEATALRQGRGSLLAGAPLLAGCLLTLYVWRVGGDQLHARAVLPALFTVLLPVMVLPVRRVLVTVVGALVVWAAVCVSPLRMPYDGGDGRFFDERAHMVQGTGDRHPGERSWSAAFPALTTAVRSPQPSLWYFDGGPARGSYRALPLAPGTGRPVVAAGFPGVVSSAAPLDTVVADMWGSTDPLAAHLAPVIGWWPGQEKYLGNAWLFARYAAPAAALPGPGELTRYRDEAAATTERVAAARRALGCGALAELGESTGGRLTAGRFWHNLTGSAARTRLRVPREPASAVREFCPRRGTPALDPKNGRRPATEGHRPATTPVRDAPRTP
jgi:arabinofuranosyltransferase